MRIYSFLIWLMANLWSITIAVADPIMTDDPLLSDPDLLASLEIFMGMSPEEKEGAITGLLNAVGNDPVQRAEMEDLLKKLLKLSNDEQLKASPGGIHSSIQQMIRDDEIAKAKQDAAKMLDGTSWEFFSDNHEAILDSTIASGQLSTEDAARFKKDKKAWKKQLRIIYDDVTSKEL